MKNHHSPGGDHVKTHLYYILSGLDNSYTRNLNMAAASKQDLELESPLFPNRIGKLVGISIYVLNSDAQGGPTKVGITYQKQAYRKWAWDSQD